LREEAQDNGKAAVGESGADITRRYVHTYVSVKICPIAAEGSTRARRYETLLLAPFGTCILVRKQLSLRASRDSDVPRVNMAEDVDALAAGGETWPGLVPGALPSW